MIFSCNVDMLRDARCHVALDALGIYDKLPEVRLLAAAGSAAVQLLAREGLNLLPRYRNIGFSTHKLHAKAAAMQSSVSKPKEIKCGKARKTETAIKIFASNESNG
jgi:hypothetical protein